MSFLSSERPSLELWAGTECTVNRVGDTFFDQLDRTGHATRVSDLELFAELGVQVMRYPVLWERTAPHGVQSADWSWADERLGCLRELGMQPIVGLMHHGSGPHHTSLIDPAFPAYFAQFARAVAERYPWVERYTPVNEPLTTARFSGMYGHWYPHGRDDLTFARALLTQCRAVVLAMRAIREINPAAQLVQTDDLGKTFSTPTLAYQAELENERRWLTFDLLCGRMAPDHPMWQYLRRAGVDEAELQWFVDNPCPPDVIGINHYLSSERFLDENLERYPVDSHGGNGRHTYADVLAARVRADGPAGPRVLLSEAWERYHLPLAITEAHNGCTREEQLRWLWEVWRAAGDAQHNGVSVQAVTAWSLLGTYDWNSLVTRADGYYEPGVFDVRAPRPRATALAEMLRDLAGGHEPSHPVLATPGWWHRSERFIYGFSIEESSPLQPSPTTAPRLHTGLSIQPRPIIITGATGTLGRAFARICEARGLVYHLLSRADMDIVDATSVDAMLEQFNPWAVINAAGYVRVDHAEQNAYMCYRENADGAAVLAAACAKRNMQFLTFSSDLVFDGTQQTPYVESNAVAPLNVYGRSKAEAEKRVLQTLPSAPVIRTSAFFGPWDQYNFVTIALRVLAAGERFLAANDAMVSPTYVPDLVHTALDLLIDGEQGIWHLANAGTVTWADLARRAAELAGMDAASIASRSTETLGLVAQRPLYSVLGSERGMLLPSHDNALVRYFRECEIGWNNNRSIYV